MKKLITISLLAVVSYNLNAAEIKTQPSPDKPASKQEDKGSYLSGVYIAPVGVIKYPDLDRSPLYGAGLVLGFELNKHVSLDATLISFKTPDNWKGSAIDEVDVNANFVLFSAAKNKLNVYGVAGGARDFNSDDWGLNIGAGLDYVVSKHVDIFGQYVYQVWKDADQSGQVQFGIGYSF